MSSSFLDFLMVEQEEAKTTNLEIVQPSRISIKMKTKLRKRRRSNSRAVHQLMQQSERRSSSNGVLGRKVKTLKELVPNSHKCVGVDGLFRETADYILALQFKVQVMQTMIDMVSNSADSD